jgi:hypothetical protein
MRRLLVLLALLAPAPATAQVLLPSGETTHLCRLWDGTDVLAIDAAGAISCNAGTNLNTSALLTTAAHDAAFGTAGSADAQVRTIQGIASMTPVQVSQSGTWTIQPGNTANTTPWLVSVNEGGVTADVFDLTNSNPQPVAIVDGSGDQITSFGGGVQYTEGDTDATPTGTLAMWLTGAADTVVAASVANPFPVEIFGPLTAGNVQTDVTSVAGVAVAGSTSGRLPIDGADDGGVIACNESAAISVSSSGNNEIVALTSNLVIYVCSFSLVVRGTVEVQWIYGTGSACATGETNLTGPYSFQVREGISQGSGLGTLFRTAESNALCLELSGAVQVDGVVSYRKVNP